MNETWWVDPGQLDADQRRVLAARPETDLLIVGPPGSGKTNILMLRANYVRSVAPRLLFLTFTRTLSEFLRAGPNVGRGDQIQPEEISTFMGWAKRFLHEQGAPLADEPPDFEESRQAHLRAIETVIERNGVGRLYDVIIIDEVQDFWDDELRLLHRLTEHMNAAGDARQSIFTRNEGLQTMAEICSETVQLTRHYRIGRRICDYADRILPPKPGDRPMIEGCNYDETARPSSVVPVPCADLSAQYRACIESIRQQVRYITDEPILVIAQRRDVRDEFWVALQDEADLVDRAMVQHQNAYQGFGPDSLIRVMTIASAKGSEGRAVHILESERLGNKRELAFTAVTRAKTEVRLYHSGPLPGQLAVPADRLPSIDALF